MKPKNYQKNFEEEIHFKNWKNAKLIYSSSNFCKVMRTTRLLKNEIEF